MANAAVIVVGVFGELFLLALLFYFYVHYCWSEERPLGEGIAYKLIVLLSLALALQHLVLLPLDFLAGADSATAFPLLWSVIFYIWLGLMLLVVPLAFFYYDKDDGTGVASKLLHVAVDLFVFSAVIVAVGSLLYAVLGHADVKVEIKVARLSALSAEKTSIAANETLSNSTSSNATVVVVSNSTLSSSNNSSLSSTNNTASGTANQTSTNSTVVETANQTFTQNFSTNNTVIDTTNQTLPLSLVAHLSFSLSTNETLTAINTSFYTLNSTFTHRTTYFDFAKSFFLFVGYTLFAVLFPAGLLCMPVNLLQGFFARPRYVR